MSKSSPVALPNRTRRKERLTLPAAGRFKLNYESRSDLSYRRSFKKNRPSGPNDPLLRSEGTFASAPSQSPRVSALRFGRGGAAPVCQNGPRAGFPLKEIREILNTTDEGDIPCRSVLQRVRHRSEDLDHQIAEMIAMKSKLEALLKRWTTDLPRPTPEEICPLIESLKQEGG